MKTILITGGEGFIGSYLLNYFKNHYKVIGTVIEKEKESQLLKKMDITDKNEVFKLIKRIRPEIIIHTAGIKDVKFCENNIKTAKLVNEEGTSNVAEAAAETGSFLIYLSTDYVFDGKKGNYTEKNKPKPITVYGRTKLGGEVAIKEKCKSYAICRSSGVYAKAGKNIATFILGELQNKRKQNYFTDVFNSPTYIESLANMLSKIAKLKKTGIYHLAGSERISRYEMALKTAEVFGLDKRLIIPIELGDNKRKEMFLPKDVSLNVTASEKALNKKFMNVKQGLNAIKRDEK